MKKKRIPLRHIVQAARIALTNGYLYGFASGRIYTGKTKDFRVPGLSCYSCPGALGSCPVGALQATLDSPGHKFAFYTLGILMLFGSIFGRFICGWLCLFGFVQDLLYKIPVFAKKKNLPLHKHLKWTKYAVLALFVVILPSFIADAAGLGEPWFCDYICPSGTLFGGIPLIAANEGLRSAIGFRFWWKIALLVLILIGSIKYHRPFCKYLCPLGAAYSLFNPIALYRYKIDHEKCTGYCACRKACKADISPHITPNSSECIRCGDCIKACPHSAIKKYNIISEIKKEVISSEESENKNDIG